MRQKGKHNAVEIKSSANLSEGDFWADIPEEIKQAIQKAKDQLDREEGISHAQVMVMAKARFLDK
ncbi:hypothetical protein [Mucilaginibacter sp. FT3.2]|uniref:hypothetical protein n=1 Tax=Mucilaginibacter sp. FT3.2 TaxID=2723090 RepID=UPI001608126D|nr:hypothetical protein [Mucilaginibacter sp. FT3.2]MBB6234440.1 hypothetical protein [Mucilaginibacter sp. FT3.2]